MKPIPRTLLQFADHRYRAYQMKGTLTGPRAAAISKIKRVAGFYTSKPASVHFQAIKQLEREIRVIIPSEKSRYLNLRIQMLDLLAAVPGP